MSETTTNLLTKTLNDLQTLSRNWAILALSTSAGSLKATADFLEGLSAKLTTEAPAEEAPAEATVKAA
jgi:hypothetical protein